MDTVIGFRHFNELAPDFEAKTTHETQELEIQRAYD